MQTIADGEDYKGVVNAWSIGRKAKTERNPRLKSKVGRITNRNFHSKRRRERREGEGRFPGPPFLGKVASSSGEIRAAICERAEMIGEKIIQFRGRRGNGNLERGNDRKLPRNYGPTFGCVRARGRPLTSN